MSNKSEQVDIRHLKKKNKLSSKRQKLNFSRDLYDLNVISSLSGSINRDHENIEENVCRIGSSLDEQSQMTSKAQMKLRGEFLENDNMFKTSALEDSLVEIFVSKNKPEEVKSLDSDNVHNVNDVSESTVHEKENVVKDNSFSCPLCWKNYTEKELFLGHLKLCGNKHNKSAKWLLEAVHLQEKQKAEREALGLPNVLHGQSNKRKTSVKRVGNTKGDTNLQLALALSASLKDAEDIEKLEQEQCLLELGVGDEVVRQQKNTLEKFHFTNSRPVLLPLNPRAKSVNKNGNYVLLKRTQADRENILSEKVTRLLAENEKVTTELNDCNEEIAVCEYLQKYHRKDDTLWHKASDSSDLYQQDYYVHKLTDFISPCNYAVGSKLKYIPQYSAYNEASEIKCSGKQNATEVKDVDSSSGKSPSTSTVKNNNTLAKIFISDWKCMLNKKAFSDITIFVDKGKKIFAHKLVFYARCPLLLKDIIKEENAENKSPDMLMWLEIPHSAALAFLEYIYCSSTNKMFTLRKSELANLRKLVQRYHVRDLLAHLKLAKSIRTKSSNISLVRRKSSEGGGYIDSVSPVKNHQFSGISEISANTSNTDDASITVPENEKICSNTSIRSESPDLFKDENSESFLTDSCHVKDRQSQESSRADIDFLVSLLDKSPSAEHMSVTLNKSTLEAVSKPEGVVNNTAFKASQMIQKSQCTKAYLRHNNYNRENLKMEQSNGNRQRLSTEENQVLSFSQKKYSMNTPIFPNSTNKPYQENLQNTSSPLKAHCSASSSWSDIEAEYSNTESTEIVIKHDNSVEENLIKHSLENSHLECSSQITTNDSFKKNAQEEVHEISVSEHEDSSENQSSLFVKSSCKNFSRSGSESPNYVHIEKNTQKSKTLPEAGHALEQSCSTVHSSTPIKSSFGQTCLENKRKHSESASSSNETPKKMRGEQTNVKRCEELESTAFDTSTTAQCSAESGLREQLDISLSKNDEVGRITCSITFEAVAGKLNSQVHERDDKSTERKSKHDNSHSSDKEWDSFDEICHASPAGIFSLPLTSHLKNKTPLKENETILNKETLHSSQPVKVADSSFLASLNESLLWREENAPKALCKTPQSTRMADDVTPPVDYNILRTAEIKKELRKYGLKSSLTKKQARTMLQYIYDQLHPWISDTEETSTSGSTQPEFKLPCNSPPKTSCSPSKVSKDPVRRNLLESCSQQHEMSSESESELPLSQQSFSSTSSALSEIITAEEIHSDVQEDNLCATQEVLSAQELKVAVHRFILSNKELHQKILLCEPIVINELHTALKNAGFKCKVDHLMDYLDEQCITFRTVQQQGRRRRKSSKNKIKKTKHVQKNNKKGTASSGLS